MEELGELVKLLPGLGPLEVPAVLGLEISLLLGIFEEVLAIIPGLIVAVEGDAHVLAAVLGIAFYCELAAHVILVPLWLVLADKVIQDEKRAGLGQRAAVVAPERVDVVLAGLGGGVLDDLLELFVLVDAGG